MTTEVVVVSCVRLSYGVSEQELVLDPERFNFACLLLVSRQQLVEISHLLLTLFQLLPLPEYFFLFLLLNNRILQHGMRQVIRMLLQSLVLLVELSDATCQNIFFSKQHLAILLLLISSQSVQHLVHSNKYIIIICVEFLINEIVSGSSIVDILIEVVF